MSSSVEWRQEEETAGKLPMGQKELLRGKVMELVKRRQLTIRAAAKELKVSYRQGRRIYASNVREGDFGPTFAAEKPAEAEGIRISGDTLRRWLTKEGLWEGKRRRRTYRSRRERPGSFGELLQFDGSCHDWFEGRRGTCCLMTMIDDAANVRYAQSFEGETAASAMEVVSYWIKRYGIPQGLYCGRKNAFVLVREPTDGELLAGITKPNSRFGRACEKLGVEVIPANSPQAKGRVERNHALDQDRLVKELRLAGISTIGKANRFLEEACLPQINGKFSRPAADPADAHVPLGAVDLGEILCFEHERKAADDYAVRFECRLFQILKTNTHLPRPGDKVIVRIRLDGSLSILWQGKPLLVEEIQISKQGRSNSHAA
jgi:hypothetical protein